MNTTGLVWYIAILMVLGASLGGWNFDSTHASNRADAFSARDRSYMQSSVTTGSISETRGRYMRIMIDGQSYQGTIHPEN